jgi:hypothetical protein
MHSVLAIYVKPDTNLHIKKPGRCNNGQNTRKKYILPENILAR